MKCVCKLNVALKTVNFFLNIVMQKKINVTFYIAFVIHCGTFHTVTSNWTQTKSFCRFAFEAQSLWSKAPKAK